ncbi:MAG: hypothetical protein ABLQ96_05915 [Candidatus Acidiferrum sp.]
MAILFETLPLRPLTPAGDFDFATLALAARDLLATFRDFAGATLDFLRSKGFFLLTELFFFTFFFLLAIKSV